MRSADHGRDQRLLARISAGEVDAVRDAVDEYGTTVYTAATRRCGGDRRRAEQVTRAAFLAVWRTPQASRVGLRPLLTRLLTAVMAG